MAKEVNTNIEKIESFSGTYRYLSNFYDAPVLYNGIMYDNAEAAYQAQKQPEKAEMFKNINGSKAKKDGAALTLRPDWDLVKDQIMYEIVKEKFTRNIYLGARLISTGDIPIIEGNYWNDTYWGVCKGKGQNKLGKIIMRVRDELKQTMK